MDIAKMLLEAMERRSSNDEIVELAKAEAGFVEGDAIELELKETYGRLFDVAKIITFNAIEDEASAQMKTFVECMHNMPEEVAVHFANMFTRTIHAQNVAMRMQIERHFASKRKEKDGESVDANS